MRPIDADNLLKGIEELRQSPCFNRGKLEETDTDVDYNCALQHVGYLERKEAVEIIVDMCIKKEPTVEAITREQYHSMTERFFDEFKENGADEETLARCIFIGLAFGKLELMLFRGGTRGHD